MIRYPKKKKNHLVTDVVNESWEVIHSMGGIFDIIATPLGYVLWFIYGFIKNYFVAIFLFTLIVRLATFPLSLKSQKMQADRARLAPRLERLQKKYKQDPRKLQEKQMQLYEKEGVSMTGGCLPLVIQMVILFGIISVIYMPLTHLAHIPKDVVNASVAAVKYEGDGAAPEGKVAAKDLTGYYVELRMMKVMDANKNEILGNIRDLGEEKLNGVSPEEYYEKMAFIRDDFTIGKLSFLDNPWSGFKNINWLWIIPILSWLTAMGSSLISMRYTNMATGGEKQPGQGCTNNMLIFMMPLFSLYITFIVPGGVGIYWICSNLIAILQTIVLNKIYNPAKIRAQAEVEYEQRRKQKAEDKKRLAESRLREQQEAARAAKEEQEAAKTKAEPSKNKKQEATSKNPNKIKRRELAAGDEENASDTVENADATAGDDSADQK